MGKTHIFNQGSGGNVTIDDPILRCCHCRRPQPKGQMVKETNWESPVYGQWTCPRDTCFEGPPPSRVPQIFGPDDLGQELNWWN